MNKQNLTRFSIILSFLTMVMACSEESTSTPDASTLPDTRVDLQDTGSDVGDTPSSEEIETDVEPDVTEEVDAGNSSDCFLEETDEEVYDSLPLIGCQDDFDHLASLPLSSGIPGARSMKTVIDRSDGNHLYFQNSQLYMIHWEFCYEHLSANGLPIVGDLATFNQIEYYSPERRFILGAITYYEGPAAWTYEIAPYDTASAEMIETAYDLIRESSFFGEDLYFHPTSAAIENLADSLRDDIPIITTDEIFAGVDYQPLNLSTSMGVLKFYLAEQLEYEYLSFRDIVVLDVVPNDISVVSGIVTGEFQTPLSHINVLSQNRGTPNMGLKGAWENETLRSLEDKWVELTVGAFDWSIREVTSEEADEYWEANMPEPVEIPDMDLSVVGVVDLTTAIDTEIFLGDAISSLIPALGGKASHYAALLTDDTIPTPPAFAIPISNYINFMSANGLDVQVEEMLEDPDFNMDPAVRDARLMQLRNRILLGTMDEELLDLVEEMMETNFPDTRMRFRSSTNAEDLDGFTGAGLYTSMSAGPDDRDELSYAIQTVWASVWNFRAFEERSYRSIPHLGVGMCVLSHRSFPDEEANGVALTANPFDTSGLEPGFYVNVQIGDNSVVQPDPYVTTDQFVYQYNRSGQPIIFYGHSNLISDGETVLTTAQTYELGQALNAVHLLFYPIYGPPLDNPLQWYAMDIEFKLEGAEAADGEEAEEPMIYIKQARPHPGW
jgi:hypothetical protein